MNKYELSKAVAKETGNTITATQAVIEATFNTIKNTISEDAVIIKGFGTFKSKEVATRVRRNPATRELITCPAYKKVKFIPGAALKNTVK